MVAEPVVYSLVTVTIMLSATEALVIVETAAVEADVVVKAAIDHGDDGNGARSTTKKHVPITNVPMMVNIVTACRRCCHRLGLSWSTTVSSTIAMSVMSTINSSALITIVCVDRPSHYLNSPQTTTITTPRRERRRPKNRIKSVKKMKRCQNLQPFIWITYDHYFAKTEK